MPAKTKCVNCDKAGFVRTEHIIKAGAAVIELFCGACGFTWHMSESGERVRDPAGATEPPDRSRWR